jgi:hypothetical protein
MSESPDVWLNPARAVFFLVKGANLEVMRLSDDLVISSLGHVSTAFVPLFSEAGPGARAAAFKELGERLGTAAERPIILRSAGMIRITHPDPTVTGFSWRRMWFPLNENRVAELPVEADEDGGFRLHGFVVVRPAPLPPPAGFTDGKPVDRGDAAQSEDLPDTRLTMTPFARKLTTC